jgi:hypothetical protein
MAVQSAPAQDSHHLARSQGEAGFTYTGSLLLPPLRLQVRGCWVGWERARGWQG